MDALYGVDQEGCAAGQFERGRDCLMHE